MPRVHHVKKARKKNPVADVGESYYWWKFRYGGKHYSKTYPKASQLTQSDFLSQLYDLQERRDDACSSVRGDPDTFEDFKSTIEEIAQELEDLGSECEDRRSNMPDQLQDSDTGQLLEDRYNRCEEMAQELQDAVQEIDEDLFDEIDMNAPVDIECPECGESMSVDIDACEVECENGECGEKFQIDNSAEEAAREEKEEERKSQLADAVEEAASQVEGIDLDCE